MSYFFEINVITYNLCSLRVMVFNILDVNMELNINVKLDLLLCCLFKTMVKKKYIYIYIK